MLASMPSNRIRSTFLMCFALSAPLTVAACDQQDDEATAVESRSDAQADAGERHSPVDRLCAALECSDAQAEQLAKLLPAMPHRDHPDASAFAAANAALADAYRAGDFDADALDAWREAVHDGDAKPKLTAESVLAIHAALDAKQRGTVADMLTAHGPHGLLGGGHGGGKRGGGHGKGKRDGEAGGKHDPAMFAAKMAEKTCEPLSCSAEQLQQITGIFADAKGSRPERGDTDTAFADAFRGASLDAGTVRAYLAGLDAAHETHASRREQTAVAVHHVLTADQREIVAAKIATEGPHALMGGKHGKHGGKHGKRGGKRGRGGDENKTAAG